MTANPSGPSLATSQREFTGAAHLSPGSEGTALSVLRPSGKARFGGHTVDVVTEGDFIPSNTPITVVQADGMRVVVRRA
jgi:membrane-bound serine protease (ClpP class)